MRRQPAYAIYNKSETMTISFSGAPLTQGGRELVRLDSLPPDKESILNTLNESARSHIEFNYINFTH